MREVEALGPYVVIRAERRPERTRSGILLPDSARGPLPRGVIEHVGAGVEPTRALAKGDRVIFVCAAQAHEVDLGDLVYVVHEEAVVARLRPLVPDGV